MKYGKPCPPKKSSKSKKKAKKPRRNAREDKALVRDIFNRRVLCPLVIRPGTRIVGVPSVAE
jgi:hypothetical protein